MSAGDRRAERARDRLDRMEPGRQDLPFNLQAVVPCARHRRCISEGARAAVDFNGGQQGRVVLRPARDGNIDEELRPEEMLYLMPKGPPGNGLPTRVSFEGCIVPGARTFWISFPAKHAPCWDALTGESATDSVACIFQAEEDGHEEDGGGEGERGWQSKSLEKVRKAVENGQCLKVALPQGDGAGKGQGDGLELRRGGRLRCAG